MSIDLSVVIVSWNVKTLLRGCLASLGQAIGHLSSEVFVVDNASTDGSVEMVRTEFNDVHLIENLQNLGFGKANNIALEKCRGEYVLFLNPDTVVPDKTVRELTLCLDDHPSVGMVGPEILAGNGRLLFNVGRLSLRGVAEYLFESFFSMLRRNNTLTLFKQPREVKCLSGVCWLVRKQVFDEIGTFDENLFLYGEETDFCYRLRVAGWQIYLLRHVHIFHEKGQSVRQIPRNRLIMLNLRNTLYALQKNFENHQWF
jgi:GT2 family glycosyltransferase